MNKLCIIYAFIFPNDKKYIGQTWDFRCRMKSHKYEAGCDRSNRYPLYNAINKYGWNNIKKLKLFYVDTQDLADQYEIDMINVCKSQDIMFGYNLRGGGSKGKFSEESKKKLSDACKGRKSWNKGTKGLQEAWNKGTTMKETHPGWVNPLRGEVRPHQSARQQGKTMSERLGRDYVSPRKGKNNKEYLGDDYIDPRLGSKASLNWRIKNSIGQTKGIWSPYKFANKHNLNIHDVIDEYTKITALDWCNQAA